MQIPVVENGVQVIRVSVPSMNRSNLARRLVYQASASLAGVRLGFDVVLLSSPMVKVAIPYLILSVKEETCRLFDT